MELINALLELIDAALQSDNEELKREAITLVRQCLGEV